MRHTVALLAVAATLSACAPPDPVVLAEPGDDTGAFEAQEPILRILFPELDPTDGRIHIELTPACAVEQLFVFDVDNFELAPPNSGANTDTQGHIHIALGDDYEATEFASFVFKREGITAASPIVPASFGFVRATLQNNDHSDLDQFEGWEHELEYVVDDPSGTCL
jgi:hypothetical protein